MKLKQLNFYSSDDEGEVKCNACGWTGNNSSLRAFSENGIFGDGVGGFGCPDCITDEYLQDIGDKND